MTIKPSEVKPTIGRHMLADGLDIIFDNERSKGVWVHDSVTGRDYLDLFTCFATIPVGYNHPKLMDPAFIDKLGRVAVNKLTLSDIYSEDFAEFVDTFIRVAKPDEFKYLFWVEGGALAIENAFKVAMDWKVRLNINRGETRGHGRKVIHFRECFHGRTGYTMSCTNTDPIKTMYFTKFDWPRVVNPKITFPLDENLDEVLALEEKALAQIEDIFTREADDICAIVIEPIQGEGGDNHFREEFFAELRRLCDEHDALLIFDEVQTGVGLTGKMWCYQNFSVVPDIVAFGKKTQVCGIMVNDRIDNVSENVFHQASRINSTWGGNIVDMVRFKRILEIIEEEDLIGNVNRVAPKVMEILEGIRSDFPKLISNVRGRGLFAAFDVATADMRDRLRLKILENGAIMLGCGWKSLRLRPSLTFSEDDAQKAGEILRESCAEISKALE